MEHVYGEIGKGVTLGYVGLEVFAASHEPLQVQRLDVWRRGWRRGRWRALRLRFDRGGEAEAEAEG